jgi:DNA-directed RNA polymerase subunit beta
MTQMKRNIQDRMSTIEAETITPDQLSSTQRPLQAAYQRVFTTNQLSQFMQQQNMLAELEHFVRSQRSVPEVSPVNVQAFEVRDVHTSHYGRLCPIHTPEGPNIGLILRLVDVCEGKPFRYYRDSIRKGKERCRD